MKKILDIKNKNYYNSSCFLFGHFSDKRVAESKFFSFHTRNGMYNIHSNNGLLPTHLLYRGTNNMFAKRKLHQFHTPKKKFAPPVREDFITRLDYEKKLDSDQLKQLDISLLGGNLILLAGKQNEIHCRIQWDGKPDLSTLPKMELIGNTYSIRSHSLNPFLGQKNRYIIELYIPAEIDILVNMTGGTIFFDGLTGKLSAALMAGDISGTSNLKLAQVKVKAGSVKMHRLQGSVDASVGIGDLEVVFDRLTKHDQVNLNCFMGDVLTRFPVGVLNSNQVIRKKGKIENNLGANISTNATLGDVFIDTEQRIDLDCQIQSKI